MRLGDISTTAILRVCAEFCRQGIHDFTNFDIASAGDIGANIPLRLDELVNNGKLLRLSDGRRRRLFLPDQAWKMEEPEFRDFKQREKVTIDRKCLKCERPFKADGRFIRMCDSCKKKVQNLHPMAVGVMGE